VVVALAVVTGGRLEGGPGSVADGEEKAEVSGDGRLGFCDKKLLRLLLKIRGKGGGLPRFGFEREGVVPCCRLLRGKRRSKTGVLEGWGRKPKENQLPLLFFFLFPPSFFRVRSGPNEGKGGQRGRSWK
jgi:hypothetical protein